MENRKLIEISGTRIFGLLSVLICLLSFLLITINNDGENPYLWGVLLLSFFTIPAVIYVFSCFKSVIFGGIKHLIFREIREKKIPEKPIVDKEINKVKTTKEEIIEKELDRTEKEKYSSFKLRYRWKIIPILLVFGLGIYMAVIYFFSGKEYSFYGINILILIMWIVGLVTIFALSLQDEWEEVLKIKRELHRENEEYKFYSDYAYNDNLVYFDSKLNRLFFRFGKMLAYLLGIAGLAVLVGLIISLISNISIAPTTIIIFLLTLIFFRIN